MSQQIQFTKLTMRNFLSYGNSDTEVDLTFAGSSLITGENLDTGGANGVGKSTIINAICYALYNNPKDKISLQRLINTTNALKNTLMEVRLFFTKGENEYEIYRARGEEYKIELRMNGENITPDSVAEADRKILEIVGISYELFTRVIIFAGSSQPFLEMPISQQRQHIEELFNITLLSEKAIVLKEKIKQTEGDFHVQEALLKEQTNTFNLYQRHLKEAEERITRWENSKAKSIADITNKLASVKDIDFEEEQALHAFNIDIKQRKNTVDVKIDQLVREVKAVAKDIQKAQTELHHLSEAKCPYCLQTFTDAPKKIGELQDVVEQKQKLNVSLTEELAGANEERSNLIEDLEIIQGSIKHENLKQLLDIQSNAGILRAKLEELNNSSNPHLEAFEQLLADEVRDADFTVLDSLKNILEHEHFLLKLLTDKNSFIRRKIINRSIPFLNSRLNGYTTELGLPHIVKFDADMSCSVSEFGRELDFGNLSSGEKKRVNIAMSLAFRDVLHHMHAKINILFADEIDMSLDTAGVDATIKLLKKKSRDEDIGVWVVMHRVEASGRFDRDVKVVKECGFSRIEF